MVSNSLIFDSLSASMLRPLGTCRSRRHRTAGMFLLKTGIQVPQKKQLCFKDMLSSEEGTLRPSSSGDAGPWSPPSSFRSRNVQYNTSYSRSEGNELINIDEATQGANSLLALMDCLCWCRTWQDNNKRLLSFSSVSVIQCQTNPEGKPWSFTSFWG